MPFLRPGRALLVSNIGRWHRTPHASTTSTFDILKADPTLGRSEAVRRAELAYLNDTTQPLNAYPAIWGPFSAEKARQQEKVPRVPLRHRPNRSRGRDPEYPARNADGAKCIRETERPICVQAGRRTGVRLVVTQAGAAKAHALFHFYPVKEVRQCPRAALRCRGPMIKPTDP